MLFSFLVMVFSIIFHIANKIEMFRAPKRNRKMEDWMRINDVLRSAHIPSLWMQTFLLIYNIARIFHKKIANGCTKNGFLSKNIFKRCQSYEMCNYALILWEKKPFWFGVETPYLNDWYCCNRCRIKYYEYRQLQKYILAFYLNCPIKRATRQKQQE